MKTHRLLFIIATVFLVSCHSKKQADAVFYNGRVYTVDSNFTIAEAFAVSEGKITGTGTSKGILEEFDAKEKTDLQGKVVFPGFIDAHCHFFGYASDLVKANLYGTKSFDEVLQRLVDFSKTNQFTWLLGRGWDQNAWAVKEFPDKEKLDGLFPTIPVYLMRIDGHAVLCNSAALKISNITSGTKINGGEIIVKNGKLTGILIDNAVDLVKKNIPLFTKELNAHSLLEAQKNCFALGLTTVDDAGLGRDSIDMIHDLQQNNKLKIRVYAMVSTTEENKKYYFEHGPVKTDRLNVRSFKMYADGSLGSRGACLLQPYSDQSSHYGFLLHDIDYFMSSAKQILDHGFQLNVHCIGDSSNRAILKMYAELLKGHNNKRWRIEHCQVVSPGDMKLFGENDIIPSVQPTHATSDMYWAEDRLGKDRVKSAYAYLDLMKNANNMIAFGTDFPVEYPNPLYTFYAAVSRKDLKGFPVDGFQMENKIDRRNSLRAMTIMAAYSNFEEQEKGSLEKEKFADFIILDNDIMQVDESMIPKTKVIATYVNGEKVFEKQK